MSFEDWQKENTGADGLAIWQAENMIDTLPNPEEEWDRIGNALYFANQFTADPNDVPMIYDSTEDIGERLWGEKMSQGQIAAKIKEEEERPWGTIIRGALSRGGLRLSKALADLPRHTLRQGELISQRVRERGQLGLIGRAAEPFRPPLEEVSISNPESSIYKILGNPADWVSEGVDQILKNHPEWEGKPPKNVLDLISDPKKLAQAVLESVPLLVGAGALMFTGHPIPAVTLMYASEGQEAYEQAKADGATDIEAEQAFAIYGSVAAALEYAQIRRGFKLIKGGYKAIVARSAQKAIGQMAKTGTTSLTKQALTAVVEETVEEMAQGTWQEATAKMVYGKDPEGGLAGFADRRAQEAVIAATLTAVAGAGAVTAGGVTKAVERGKAEPTKEEPPILGEGGLPVEAKPKVPILGEEGVKAPEAKPAAGKVEKPKPKIAPIVEPELTKQEEADIAKLEAEIEEPFEMERVKGLGFVIKEKATGKEAAVVPKRKQAKAKLVEFNKGERKIQETKRKPKLLTEKASIGELITEARALKAAMKKAAQAARKAYKVGKREGIEKVKTHYRELKLREQARKTLKTRIDKAVKAIAKDVPTSVDYFYREAIETLRAGIDPSFRTEKTREARARTIRFLEQNPDKLKDIPVKLMRALNKKTLAEYKITDLEELATEIERLTKLGKLKRKLKVTQRERSAQKKTDEIISNVEKSKPIKVGAKAEAEPVVYSTTKEGIIQRISPTSLRAWTLRPMRIFDLLDGGKGTFSGPAHVFFYDNVNKQWNAELRGIDKRKDGGMAKLKELGLTFERLNVSRTVVDVEYRLDEMMGIYAAAKNPSAKLAIMYGNNITDEMIRAISKNLTNAEKAWVDYIVQEYDDNYNRLREAVIESENRDMGHEENYTPIRRRDIEYKTTNEEIKNQLLQREHFRKAYAEHGFSIQRKNVPAEFQKPIDLNLTKVWLDQIAKQEHYIRFSRLIKQLHRIADDPAFGRVVSERLGKDYLTEIKNYIDRVANPNIYKTFHRFEKMSRTLRGNVAVAYLAYNMLTIAKQIPSFLLYLQDAGPAHLMTSLVEFSYRPLEMTQLVREKDPQVKYASIERELEEFKRSNSNEYNRIVKTIGKPGMYGIKLVDGVVRTIGWNAVYQKAIATGASEAEAVRLAQNATLRTQPAAAAKDVAGLYATSEYLNWFTMFTNQLNQIYNIATYDFTAYVKNEDYQKAALATVGLSLTALTIWCIAHRRLPEDKDDLMQAAAEETVNAIPLVGRAIASGMRGWGDNEPPPLRTAKDIGKVFSAKDKEKAALNLLKSSLALMGIPIVAFRRSKKFVETGELIELIGGKEKKPQGKLPKKINR